MKKNIPIFASNVYEVDDNFSIFRSTRSTSLASASVPLPGDTGISYHTNRFNLSVMEGQFNNVNTGIFLETDPTGNTQYSVAAGTSTGICADGVYIYHNYFGAEPTSTTAYSGGSANSSEYMSDAIILSSPNTSNWFNLPMNSGGGNHEINIISNKIDRAFRGININGMWDMPAAVQHNSVNIEDDYTFNNGGTTSPPAFGYGIAVQNKLSNVSINNNTLTGQYSNINSTNSVSLVFCKYIPNGGASVTCNMVSQSNYGFEFNDWCNGTTWSGNYMCDNWSGLALTSNGVIGQQGAAGGNSCADYWSGSCTIWGSGLTPYNTFVDNSSNPSNSPLYFILGSTSWMPTNNGPMFGGNPYSNLNLNNLGAPITNYGGDCWQQDLFANTYPLWRSVEVKNFGSDLIDEQIEIYPNPFSSEINIKLNHSIDLNKIELFDLEGLNLTFNLKSNGNIYNLDLQKLLPGLYLLSLPKLDGTLIKKKIIKIN